MNDISEPLAIEGDSLSSRELVRVSKRIQDTQAQIAKLEPQLKDLAREVVQEASGAEAKYGATQEKIEKLRDRLAMFEDSRASEENYLAHRAEIARQRDLAKAWVQVRQPLKQRLALAKELSSSLDQVYGLFEQVDALHKEALEKIPAGVKVKRGTLATSAHYHGLIVDMMLAWPKLRESLSLPVTGNFAEIAKISGGRLVDQVSRQNELINSLEAK